MVAQWYDTSMPLRLGGAATAVGADKSASPECLVAKVSIMEHIGD